MSARWTALPYGRDSRPGQVVTSAAELDALPEYTLIVGVGDDPVALQKWDSPSYVDGYTAAQLIQAPLLPIRFLVVWVPPVAVR